MLVYFICNKERRKKENVANTEMYRLKRAVLDCSDENVPFYQKLGYSYQDNCMKIMHK